MKKKTYTATALLRDSTHEWEIVIYSRYESALAAKAGVERFAQTMERTPGVDIVEWAIYPNE